MLMLLDGSLSLDKNNSILRVNIVQKLCNFSLSIILLVCSSWAYADGLFDFQMTLAKKGNAEAEFKVGEMYETGFGVKKDMNEARNWINKAAAQGHETANFKLLYWDVEKNGLKGDNKSKFTELRTKAEDGNAQAMYYLGKMYANGVGVKQNYDTSLDWLNKATFVGVLEAERESLLVRERKQKALEEDRKAEESRKAKEKAQQEEIKKAEAKKKLEEEKRLKAEADREKRQQESRSQSAQKKELEEQNRKKAEAAAKQAEEEKQEAEKQALLKREAEKRKEKAKSKDSKFTSDPCSGKSARFLSTCR